MLMRMLSGSESSSTSTTSCIDELGGTDDAEPFADIDGPELSILRLFLGRSTSRCRSSSSLLVLSKSSSTVDL